MILPIIYLGIVILIIVLFVILTIVYKLPGFILWLIITIVTFHYLPMFLYETPEEHFGYMNGQIYIPEGTIGVKFPIDTLSYTKSTYHDIDIYFDNLYLSDGVPMTIKFRLEYVKWDPQVLSNYNGNETLYITREKLRLHNTVAKLMLQYSSRDAYYNGNDMVSFIGSEIYYKLNKTGLTYKPDRYQEIQYRHCTTFSGDCISIIDAMY